ncbi:hypothetical protein [Allosphingosinicella sp.]|uniref:hypothetical protein n=1 Tax=Allosphingosinicella sp. TaxID=2823234 RepID=UPI002FC1A7FA
MFDRDKVQRTTAAIVAALIFSSVSVSAAVGPARSLETAPAQVAQVQDADRANA